MVTPRPVLVPSSTLRTLALLQLQRRRAILYSLESSPKRVNSVISSTSWLMMVLWPEVWYQSVCNEVPVSFLFMQLRCIACLVQNRFAYPPLQFCVILPVCKVCIAYDCLMCKGSCNCNWYFKPLPTAHRHLNLRATYPLAIPAVDTHSAQELDTCTSGLSPGCCSSANDHPHSVNFVQSWLGNKEPHPLDNGIPIL